MNYGCSDLKYFIDDYDVVFEMGVTFGGIRAGIRFPGHEITWHA